jgi:hypothetical protein
VVGVQPQHDPRTVTVQVLGTHVYVNVDSAGRFILDDLAQGRYRLRLETTEEGYTPTFEEVDVETGNHRILPDTLHLTYTGIPSVTGLRVVLDTLAGVARVSWNKARFASLESYMIYRDPRDALDPARQPIALTRDTFWIDTLYPPRLDGYGLATGQFPAPQALAYRVKVRNHSVVVGVAFGAAEIEAVPPSWVTTFAMTGILGLLDGEASRGDTVRVALACRNRSRVLARVKWLVRGALEATREHGFPGRPREAADTLILIGESLGKVEVEARVYDEAGDSVSSTASFSFVMAPPLVDAGEDTLVWRGGEVRLQGRATTRFGGIVNLAWDVGATGRFTPSPLGQARFTAPDSFSNILCVLRATNADGEDGYDTVVVHVGEAWEKVIDSLPFLGNMAKAVHFGGRLWIIGGRQGGLFSTGTGLEWTREPDVPGVTDRVNHAAYSIGGRLWIAAGEEARTGRDFGDIWSSADGRLWTKEEGIPPFENSGLAAEHQGRVWVMPDSPRGNCYSTVNGKDWDEHTTRLDLVEFNGSGFSFGSYGGHLLAAGGRSDVFNQGTSYGVLWTAPDGKAWQSISIGPNLVRVGHSMVAGGGRIWVIGGEDENGIPLKTTANSVGDPFNWHGGPSFPEPIGPGNVSFYLDGTVWVIHDGALWRLR